MTEAQLLEAALAVNKARQKHVIQARKEARQQTISTALGALIDCPGGQAEVVGHYTENGVDKVRLSKVSHSWKTKLNNAPSTQFSTTPATIVKWRFERYDTKLADLKEEAQALKAGEVMGVW